MATNGLPNFTARLNALFDASRDPATGRPYTNTAVADALRTFGVDVSASYLGKLRKESKAEPSASIVGALAHFFDVSADYFLGRTARIAPGELARRLTRLVERTDRRLDEQGLIAAVAAGGEPFGDAAWERLRTGGEGPRPREGVLEAIADFCGVPRDYLTEPSRTEQVELTEAQFELVEAMTGLADEGLSFRELGAPTAEGLRLIAAALRRGHAADGAQDS